MPVARLSRSDGAKGCLGHDPDTSSGGTRLGCRGASQLAPAASAAVVAPAAVAPSITIARFHDVESRCLGGPAAVSRWMSTGRTATAHVAPAATQPQDVSVVNSATRSTKAQTPVDTAPT